MGPSPIEVSVGAPRLFWAVEGSARRIYGHAGSLDGVTVHGRGVRLPISVANTTGSPVEFPGIQVVARRGQDGYPPSLRYDRLETGLGSARLPLEGEGRRVRLTSPGAEGCTVAVAGSRCTLPAGAARGFDLFVEAAVSGLWECSLDVAPGPSGGSERIGSFLVLLRGR
ncbi:hypothetical protein SAMN05444920_107347 [Nonomuraea solani]|uniref:Uncharacterized protein n=1 Tax=Nonomuraea solani TaxID=1144553 RepID=A0A1H6E443_9ACTN|nr:hypothetical protein [Nonomuraea solani]SEG91776.1 hypothetical protein SAMN05444920_107347 [Nonomuraea solani]